MNTTDLTITRIEDSPFTYDDVIKLIHESVQERLDQNLHFTVSRMNAETFKEKSKDGVVLVAYKGTELIGTTTAHVGVDKDGVNYSFPEHTYVSPAHKREGIGSILDEKRSSIAKSKDCKYIICDTAVEAKSSVKWHLKVGYKIIGLRSFKSTNYYSYVFRKQLVYDPLWSNSWYCKMRYCLSAMKCKLKYKANGEYTPLMKLVIKICSFI